MDGSVKACVTPSLGSFANWKNINFSLFLIRPLSEDHLSQLTSVSFVVSDFPIQKLDQWMEALRPVLHPSWVGLEVIPLHAWDERFSSAWVSAWWK